MNNKIKSLFFISLLLISKVLQASFCGCIPKNYQDYRVYVAPQIARLKFTIDKLAAYRGVFKGGSFGVEYKPFCSFYSGAFLEWMMGDCSSSMKMSRYIHDIDGQVRFGYNFPMWNYYKLTFTPFLGLGFIEAIHHIRPDGVLPSEKFRYYNYYLPFGCIAEFRLTKHFGFGVMIEKKKCINQRLKTPYIEGIKFALNQNSGYLLEVPFYIRAGNKVKFEMSIIPYLKREVDGRLHAKLPDDATLFLPKQEYKYWGMRLGFGALF